MIAAPLGVKGFIVPAGFGACTGVIIALLFLRVNRLLKTLSEQNTNLEKIVEQRTQELNERNKKLEEYSYTDGLTMVANRRHFESVLSTECKRLSRVNVTLSLILCDVDFFKNFNDHYGHQAGDDCLKKVAAAIRGVAQRETDLVARYGGEEFAVILPVTKRKDALLVAENIRKAVKELSIPHADSNGSEVVTISIGVSALESNTEGHCGNRLIAEADKCLYKAKELGRDQVQCVSSTDDP